MSAESPATGESSLANLANMLEALYTFLLFHSELYPLPSSWSICPHYALNF